jgi:hypothetical protein
VSVDTDELLEEWARRVAQPFEGQQVDDLVQILRVEPVVGTDSEGEASVTFQFVLTDPPAGEPLWPLQVMDLITSWVRASAINPPEPVSVFDRFLTEGDVSELEELARPDDG